MSTWESFNESAPGTVEDQLLIVGMPNTLKFRDLERDPRFCLYTTTVDTLVTDGDVKPWGTVTDITDKDVHQRFATALFEKSGMDLRGQEFDDLFAAELVGASSIESGGDHLGITIWRPGEPGAHRPQGPIGVFTAA